MASKLTSTDNSRSHEVLPLEAIILAGGRGTRLSTVVRDLPKPMAPVADKPFLTYLLTSLLRQHFTHIYLSTGYMAESIETFYGASFEGMPISYAREESPLGTGGGIRVALEKTAAMDVFIFNGDSLSVTDLSKMMEHHRANREKVSVALCRVLDTNRYGAVEVADDHIIAFSEKGILGPGYINSGIYIVRRDLFADFGLPAAFSFEQFLAANLEALHPAAFLSSGPFIDIGVPEDYARAQTDLPSMLGQ